MMNSSVEELIHIGGTSCRPWMESALKAFILTRSGLWQCSKLDLIVRNMQLWPRELITTTRIIVDFGARSRHLRQRKVLTPRSVLWDVISYPLFADADTGIYPHAASQYHARPKAKRGIAMLSVDKFPYPRKQTRGNEFIPCSNNICDILKRFRSFKIPAITLIWPKSPYKHSVTRSYRSGKESGRRSESPLWRHQWRSFVFISHADDVKREIRLHIPRLLTNQKRESARSMG